MHPFPSLFGFTLLLASNSVLADNATSIFPDTFAENDRAECHACLTDLIEDTCDGPSDTSCYCTGSGAVKFRDECFITCCSATTYCQGQTYTEWWLQCVDDHPQWCHDPPKKAWGGMDLDLQEEHCSEEEIESAEKLASATSTAPACTATAEWDLSEFNRDCEPVPSIDAEDVGVVVSVTPILCIVVVFAVGWLH